MSRRSSRSRVFASRTRPALSAGRRLIRGGSLDRHRASTPPPAFHAHHIHDSFLRKGCARCRLRVVRIYILSVLPIPCLDRTDRRGRRRVPATVPARARARKAERISFRYWASAAEDRSPYPARRFEVFVKISVNLSARWRQKQMDRRKHFSHVTGQLGIGQPPLSQFREGCAERSQRYDREEENHHGAKHDVSQSKPECIRPCHIHSTR